VDDTSFTASFRRLTALRLRALGIDPSGDRRPDAPGAVVRAALALQAQDYPGTLWAVGLRTEGATRDQVEVAHEAGDFVRSWTMRGTLHVVVAEDLPWMLALTGDRMMRASEGRRQKLGLEHADLLRAERIVRDRLADGATSSRAELFSALNDGGIATAGQRGVHILGQLAHTSVIVLVGQAQWALLEDRVPSPRVMARVDALREFALRYFLGHGPATVRDFAWWSSLTLTDARAGLVAARDQLEELSIDGESYYARPGLEESSAGVHLLPGFDEYVLGYADRRAPLAGRALGAIAPGANGLFLSTIVVDGQIVGTWRRTLRARSVQLGFTPFDPVSSSTRRRIEAAGERYARFLERPVELVTDPSGA
jgi:hypothetical protein